MIFAMFFVNRYFLTIFTVRMALFWWNSQNKQMHSKLLREYTCNLNGSEYTAHSHLYTSVLIVKILCAEDGVIASE